MLSDKKFDIEHALNMYARSYAYLPASGIYDKEIVAGLKPDIAKCHIYLVGTLPTVEAVTHRLENGRLVTQLRVAGELRELAWPVPKNARLEETEKGVFVEKDGLYWAPSERQMMARLSNELNIVPFDVLYIGQAYGKKGSRNALDRLLKHETLQKISLKGIAPDRALTLLLLEIEPANRMFTIMNPRAKIKTEGPKRISAGLDKLFATSEAERVTLYEASLIRYFQPPFNREFKDSFPSTNLKILADCYDKDFSAVVSEIKLDELPFKLSSGIVAPEQYHTALFNLHEDEARRVFFRPGFN